MATISNKNLLYVSSSISDTVSEEEFIRLKNEVKNLKRQSKAKNWKSQKKK